MHEVNYLAVLIAGVVPMLVGAVWYGPLFGKRWLGYMETTEEEIRKDFNPFKTYGVSFLLALVTAFILAQLLAGMGGQQDISSLQGNGGRAMVGVHLGLMALIAFVLPVAYQSVAFEGRKAGLFWLNLGYNGVALLGQGVVIAAWS
ncbi:MAG: DUF1761 domain-containing protein [Gemmatimonadetes bacterium]|nr:DUF1761 domain-containing protein [Gemmatimonadota bacterium]